MKVSKNRLKETLSVFLKEFLPFYQQNKNYSAEYGNNDGDEEVRMAKSELYSIIVRASKLYSMIGDDEEVESWVQSNISRSAESIDTVYRFLMNGEGHDKS